LEVYAEMIWAGFLWGRVFSRFIVLSRKDMGGGVAFFGFYYGGFSG
jgi:hypothetical protein